MLRPRYGVFFQINSLALTMILNQSPLAQVTLTPVSDIHLDPRSLPVTTRT